MLKKFVLFLLVVVTSFGIYGQHTVSGVVTDSSNDPIPGVSILVQGTTSGTITQVDGSFSINTSIDAILVFSFIGFENQEVSINGRSVIKVVMESAFMDLDEVVVVGYGVQKKRLITGATSQVSSDVISGRNTTSPIMALQGQAAGISVMPSSGQPGESARVTIRGVGTTGDASPLYIVDGIATGNIDHLNPSDIESIDVLKDAASAAIYGSRAANGVVLVTTKSGRAGVTQLTFDAYVGFQNRPRTIDLLNAQEYAMIMNEQYLNGGGNPRNLPFDVNNLPAYTEAGPANTDWLDEMFVRNAITQNYVFGASGGNDQSTYSTSISYTGQEGIVGGRDYSNYERISARFNSENRFYDGQLRMGHTLNISHIERNGIGVGGQYNNSLRGAFNTSPLMPVYDDNGDFFRTDNPDITDQNGNRYWNQNESNPYASMVYNNNNVTEEQRLLGSVYAELDITPNLTFRSMIGVDYYSSDRRQFNPQYRLSPLNYRPNSSVEQSMSKGMSWSAENYLTYNLYTNGHSFDVMAGTSSRQYKGSWLFARNTDFVFSSLDYAYISNTTNLEGSNINIGGHPHAEDKLLSYFGRIQYHFDETYMFNATFRADGSSKFAKNNRWGYFPSFSAGWVMSNEAFMEPILDVVSFLKLRGSWGQNGSQNVSAFQYMAPIQFTQANYAFGDTEGVSTSGSFPSRLANEDLQWETSEQINLGFDAFLLNNRLFMNFDLYRKSTKDWLVLAPVLATYGTGAPYINGGNVINEGVEVVLGYNQRIRDLSYSVNVNGAFNRNEVTEVPTEDGIIHGANNVLFDNAQSFYRAQSGYPIGYFWGLKTDGIFQSMDEVRNHVNSEGRVIQPNARPGDIRYVDVNDDGTISHADKVKIGDPNPSFIYGLSFSLDFRAFDFSVVTNGVAGNQIVQSYRNHTNQNANYTRDILDRWNGPGTSNTVPRVTEDNINYSASRFSDIFIQDGDYFRISNVTLGYDISNLMFSDFFNRFRVYASVQNLYTFTNYTGMDPDIGYGHDGGVGDRYSSGIDLGFYPRPRTVLFGVNMTF
ncbi:SusC/RagA family TonB-linked outer membrane protein [Natronoflexus pectinivorans]|uniref:TonB-linked SusC/RagA family outer membrane protein n=1 Tax=Natronoflexus pectinivorans TaxID=682526 RepID=A0A4R2GJJ6_9BACT|nr:TonB-dependent receptor [Natronoflexus pectinivorans]TCO08850.1 TonB-linked SusC/RagA family outer membrane protein [Natronoflexus pectinivorans]